MKRFLVVQHTYSEFLGSIEQQLENRGIGFHYVRPFTGQAVPASALQYDALWLLGAAHAVTDREHCPWIEDELRLVRAFARAARPVIGFGFGGLVLALAAGGAAHAQPAQRAYWTTARSVLRGDPLADAVDGRKVLVMANGRVELAPGVSPVLTDEAGAWIAVRTAAGYGMLFRPEHKPGMIEDMMMEEGRPLPDNIGNILEEARAMWPETQRTTQTVVTALAAALGLMQERRKPPVIVLRTTGGGSGGAKDGE